MKLEDAKELISEFTKLSTTFYDSVLHKGETSIRFAEDDNLIVLNAYLRQIDCIFEFKFETENSDPITEIYFRTDMAQEITLRIADREGKLENDNKYKHFILIPKVKDIPTSLEVFKCSGLNVAINIRDIVDVNKEIKCYAIPYTYSKYGFQEV